MLDPTGNNRGAMLELQGLGRRALAGLLIACGMVLVVRVVTLSGWVRPVRVVGGSMAECLWGPNYRITCQACGMRFRIGVDMPRADEGVVCPNCGAGGNRVDAKHPAAGRRVLIDRAAFLWRWPHIWEKVAFRGRQDKQWLTVKRVVAGPGARVAIRGGDLFVNGRVQAKSIKQLRDVGILVYDDRFRPAAARRLPARWRSQVSRSHWRQTKTGYCYSEPADGRRHAPDWLCYHQWICWPRPTPPMPRMAECPIVDNYGYNQALARGPFHQITDLMLSCRIELSADAAITMRLAGHYGVYLLQLEPANDRCRILADGMTVASSRYRLPKGPFLVEFAVCDQHLLVAINRQSVFWCPEPKRTSIGMKSCGRHVAPALAAVGQCVSVAQLRIDRDLYYVGPAGGDCWQAAKPVPAGNWFVLGDNVPISEDSRFGTFVGWQQLIGPVIAPRLQGL